MTCLVFPSESHEASASRDFGPFLRAARNGWLFICRDSRSFPIFRLVDAAAFWTALRIVARGVKEDPATID
jgi:hypothetical protein